MRNHVDIISSLPDELLCRIISLLPSKDAIGTSVLSSRWKNLMDFVPVLDLSCHVPTRGFINTVHNLLPSTSSSKNLQPIQKLRLQISEDLWYIHVLHVNSWIRSAINRKVVDLDVRLPEFDFAGNAVEYRETLRVIASDSLQTLNISGRLGLDMPYTTGCFKNLKKFTLKINNPDKEIMEKLFCGLPRLEKLLVVANFSMIRTRDKNISINIIVPALKWFSLCITQEDHHYADFKIRIDTPKLEYIYLRDDYLPAYSVMSLPSLVEATLELWMADHDVNYLSDKNCFARAVELIRELSNAKYLSVMYGASAALDWAGQDLPILHDVTFLELDDLPLTGLSLIPRFLESAPNLKVFVVHIQPVVNVLAGWSWISPSTLPPCLSHLEEFEIQGAEIIENKPSFNIMKNYIINNAKALKVFIINEFRLV